MRSLLGTEIEAVSTVGLEDLLARHAPRLHVELAAAAGEMGVPGDEKVQAAITVGSGVAII